MCWTVFEVMVHTLTDLVTATVWDSVGEILSVHQGPLHISQPAWVWSAMTLILKGVGQCVTPGSGTQCPSCLPHVFKAGFQGYEFQSGRTKWWTQLDPWVTAWRRAILERCETLIGLYEEEMFNMDGHWYLGLFLWKLAWIDDSDKNR